MSLFLCASTLGSSSSEADTEPREFDGREWHVNSCNVVPMFQKLLGMVCLSCGIILLSGNGGSSDDEIGSVGRSGMGGNETVAAAS